MTQIIIHYVISLLQMHLLSIQSNSSLLHLFIFIIQITFEEVCCILYLSNCNCGYQMAYNLLWVSSSAQPAINKERENMELSEMFYVLAILSVGRHFRPITDNENSQNLSLILTVCVFDCSKTIHDFTCRRLFLTLSLLKKHTLILCISRQTKCATIYCL